MTDVAQALGSANTGPADALNGGGPTDSLANVAPTPKTLPRDNFDAAMGKMNLNTQEQFLYDMHLKNLGAGGVANPAGGTSSLFVSTFDVDGKTYVVPTVWDGKILPPDQAFQMAQQVGLDKFPAYSSDDEAQKRYNDMHGYMERDTAAYTNQGQQ